MSPHHGAQPRQQEKKLPEEQVWHTQGIHAHLNKGLLSPQLFPVHEGALDG